MTICCPMPDGAAALPMVFSESLVSLHMCFTSAETLWQRFYTSNTGCIVFTRLESLVLEYTEPVGKEAKQHRIPSLFADCMDDGELCISAEDDLVEVTGKQVHPVFHKLEHLSVLKYPHSIMRVLKYFDVSRIPYVSLRDVSHGYEGLAASAITEMKSLRVHLSRPIEDSGQFQSWLNCMFSVASSMSSLQLQASVQVPATLPDIIGLSSLTSLSLGMRLDIGCLPNLLSRLPNLRCLAVHLHPVISSRSDRSPGTWGPQLLPYLPALSRSLTQLVAYVADVDCGESTGCGSWDVERELTWAVARVPSLLVLKSEEWTCKAIRSWIKELLCDDRSEARFKHLKSLEMSVWKY
ncbi:hypothetical protein EC988_003678 [Linderina pennispora]|nr:hypothetical protein EC988_003678 [Linderina pennispora]